MPFRNWLPENARPGLVLKPHPESGELIMRLTEILLRGPSSLTPAQRELIAAYTSAVNACEFCYGAHAATAEALGVDERWLTRLIDDIDTAPVDDKLKPILRYVRRLTRSPSRVTPTRRRCNLRGRLGRGCVLPRRHDLRPVQLLQSPDRRLRREIDPDLSQTGGRAPRRTRLHERDADSGLARISHGREQWSQA